MTEAMQVVGSLDGWSSSASFRPADAVTRQILTHVQIGSRFTLYSVSYGWESRPRKITLSLSVQMKMESGWTCS